MNVSTEHTIAVIMLTAVKPNDHITALVNPDILGTDAIVQVYDCCYYLYCCFLYHSPFGLVIGQ